MNSRKLTSSDIASETSDTCSIQEKIYHSSGQIHHPEMTYQSQESIKEIISSYQELIASNYKTINQLIKDADLTRQKLELTQTRYATLLNLSNSGEKIQVEKLMNRINELQKTVYQQKLQLRKFKAQKLKLCKQQQNLGNIFKKDALVQRKNIQNFFNMQSMRQNTQVVKRKRKNSLQEEDISVNWKKHLEMSKELSYDSSKFKQKTLNMLRKFIPHEERSKIWPLIFEDKLGITDTLYIDLLERKQNGLLQPYVQSQINKDIARSFDRGIKNHDKQVIGSQIREILQIFHMLRPDVSYVQGMTYPVIILTSVVGKFQAFRIFSNLVISNKFFRTMYSFQDNYVNIYCRIFDELLKQFHYSTYMHLHKLGITSQLFLVEWFFTLFSRGMSIQTTLKIWDMIGYQQELVLYRTSLAIFQIIGKRLTVEDYQHTIGLIRSYSSYIDENKLLELSIKYHLAITQTKIDKLIHKFSRETQKIYLRE